MWSNVVVCDEKENTEWFVVRLRACSQSESMRSRMCFVFSVRVHEVEDVLCVLSQSP
jgi:hypothetical protein